MESKRRGQSLVTCLGSMAVALVLVGGTAAVSQSGQMCYSCTSMCTQVGVQNGFWVTVNGAQVKIGGTGFPNCNNWSTPAAKVCWDQVQAECSARCTACMANGGYIGSPPSNASYASCSDPNCSIPTGEARDGTPTSVCLDMCNCASGVFCRDIQIPGGGVFSTQNSRCGCE